MTRALFVDVDGVLHPGPPPLSALVDTRTRAEYLELAARRERERLCWLPVLADILAPHPDVAVLVHSSWRLVMPRSELVAVLSLLGPGRAIDVTAGEDRYRSILDAVQLHGIRSYRILDDHRTDFPADCPELVLCAPDRGISDPRVQDLLRAWFAS